MGEQPVATPVAGAQTRSGEAAADQVAASRRRHREPWVPYLFIAPALLMFLLFAGLPFLHAVWLSFFDWDGITIGTWTGLDNYRAILTDDVIRSSFVHAAVLVLFFATIPVVIGLVIASLFRTVAKRGGTVFRGAIFLPQVLSGVVIGVIWTWIYAINGSLNEFLRAIGLGALAQPWLGDFTWALPAIGMIGAWWGIGLCMVLFVAGIQQIDSWPVRRGAGGRCGSDRGVLRGHAAVAALRAGRGAHPHRGRGAEDLRPRLRHDAGRPGHLDPGARHPAVHSGPSSTAASARPAPSPSCWRSWSSSSRSSSTESPPRVANDQPHRTHLRLRVPHPLLDHRPLPRGRRVAAGAAPARRTGLRARASRGRSTSRRSVRPGTSRTSRRTCGRASSSRRSVVIGTTVLSILAGYAFGTMRFRGENWLFYLLLSGMILPVEAIVIPLYYDFDAVGLTNTYWALILPQIALNVCFGTFWMRAYFRSVPRSMLEAAEIDGAGSVRTLFSVALPPGRPAVLTLVLLTFMCSWNEFLLPAGDGDRREPAYGAARPRLLRRAARDRPHRSGRGSRHRVRADRHPLPVLPAVVHPGDVDGRGQGVEAGWRTSTSAVPGTRPRSVLVETYTVEVPRGWRIALDPQPYAEVVRVDRGRCRFVLGEHEAVVSPGEIGILLPGPRG